MQESNVFFNMKHFEETIINGEWEVAEKYLSAFTKIDDNRYSKKLFYELRKQKYYEAFHRYINKSETYVFFVLLGKTKSCLRLCSGFKCFDV